MQKTSQPAPATRQAPEQRPASAVSRIAVIDVLRGLVMLIMLFDHVRETIYLHRQVTDPMTLAATEPMLFFTRLAAHFCAPLFVFLTGLSAWLYAHPAAGPRHATGFLIKRGLLLIFLELVVVNVAWAGQLPPPVLYLQVIWVIGAAMLILALMHRLPMPVLLAVALTIICGHNALSGIRFEPGGAADAFWTLLLHRGFLTADGAIKVKVSYPLLPWIGVILLGYCAGPLYGRTMAAARRRRWLQGSGLSALAALAVLRGFNLYGETLPWVRGADALQTVMSIVNLTKYPPSLDFLLLTLGTGMLGLAFFEPIDRRLTRVCATFGGAPMFYYLLHLLVLLSLQKGLVSVLGANHGDRYGVSAYWPVWLVACALIPLLYFPCRAFAGFKRRSTQAWVRYF